MKRDGLDYQEAQKRYLIPIILDEEMEAFDSLLEDRAKEEKEKKDAARRKKQRKEQRKKEEIEKHNEEMKKWKYVELPDLDDTLSTEPEPGAQSAESTQFEVELAKSFEISQTLSRAKNKRKSSIAPASKSDQKISSKSIDNKSTSDKSDGKTPTKTENPKSGSRQSQPCSIGNKNSNNNSLNSKVNVKPTQFEVELAKSFEISQTLSRAKNKRKSSVAPGSKSFFFI